MRPLFFALLLAIFASPAQAQDGGAHVTFGGASADGIINVPPWVHPGDVLWDSGPSDPVPKKFRALLFQGILEDPHVSFEASIRTRKGWGPWTAATVERFPNGRFWGRFPVSGRKGAVVRMRAVHRGIAPTAKIEMFALELAPLKREKPSKPSRSPIEKAPSTGTFKPAVIPRKAWGAAEPTAPFSPMVPMRLTIHHTLGALPMKPEDAVQEMRIIQRFHQKGRGWIDIGYHFLIDGTGRIYQGRPETVIGAHVRNKNEGNVGISLMGSFHAPRKHKATAAQVKSLIALGRWLVQAYGIDPETLRGHRDHQATSCPGDLFYPRLPEIRKAIGLPPAVAKFKTPPKNISTIDILLKSVNDLGGGSDLGRLFDNAAPRLPKSAQVDSGRATR